MPIEKKQVYCSLDIETSGFDPQKHEILEVGLVLFEMIKGKPKFLKEFGQVFKVTKPIPKAILGLTGIALEELENAPSFNEYRDEIQKLVDGSVVVGHNVGFDIKFLQGYGINFSGEILDTLDLAQIFMPTFTGYNLEGMMYHFKVSHTNAHRALADAKATVSLLEKLLEIYGSFSETLKKSLGKIFKQDAPILYEIVKHAKNIKDKLPRKKPSLKRLKQKLGIESIPSLGKFNLYPLSTDLLQVAVEMGKTFKSNLLLVMPSTAQALELWRTGFAKCVCPEREIFNENKFSQCLERPSGDYKKSVFFSKLLVWKNTNWQSESMADINFSFFGNQFKELVSGGKQEGIIKEKVLVCSMEDFFEFQPKGIFKNRDVAFFGLRQLEENTATDIGQKASWGYINYQLKNVYNPDTEYGDVSKKDIILEAMSATDLFFGLSVGLLSKISSGTSAVAIDNGFFLTPEGEKIKQAAENYAEKLSQFNKQLQIPEFENILSTLKQVFLPNSDKASWAEFTEKFCAFFIAPVKLDTIFQTYLRDFKKISVVDHIQPKISLNYLQHRLGLQSLAVEYKVPKTGQLELFVFKGTNYKQKQLKINKYLTAEAYSNLHLSDSIGKKYLPAAILFPSVFLAGEFYEQNASSLKEQAKIFLQSGSSGTSKLIKNFSAQKNGLLLISDKVFLKNNKSGRFLSPKERLNVKTLIICRLPFDSFSHPYAKALSALYKNPFMDFSLPLALNNLFELVRGFYTEDLKELYLIDVKLSKDYGLFFSEFIKSL